MRTWKSKKEFKKLFIEKAEVLFDTGSETRTLRGIVNALHIQNICATASSVKQDANGNYLDMNLPMANYYGKKYLEVLENITPERMTYSE